MSVRFGASEYVKVSLKDVESFFSFLAPFKYTPSFLMLIDIIILHAHPLLSRISLTLYLAKHDVLPVEPRGLDRAHEELRPVGVRPRVRHREGAWSRVLQLEVFVLELVAASRSVAVVEVVVTGNQRNKIRSE